MSGGEPFLRRDLPQVCEALATKNHVKQITIPTGAIASDLIARSTEETLQRCPETQIVVNLSIDHVGEKHDWIRGVPGNYEKAKKTYAKLIELRDRYDNLTVNVHTCLCTYNAEDLDELFAGVKRDFPAVSFHSFEMLRGDQPDKNIQPITTQRYRELLPKLEEYWASYQNYDGFLKFVKMYSRRMELAVLEQETQVRPCTPSATCATTTSTSTSSGSPPRLMPSVPPSGPRNATARTRASCRHRWSSTGGRGARTLRRRW